MMLGINHIDRPIMPETPDKTLPLALVFVINQA